MGEVLAPKEYLAELEQRNGYYSDLKKRIGSSKLNDDMEKMLLASLQGNFREWLSAKGYTKNLNDLVKLLDRR